MILRVDGASAARAFAELSAAAHDAGRAFMDRAMARAAAVAWWRACGAAARRFSRRPPAPYTDRKSVV